MNDFEGKNRRQKDEGRAGARVCLQFVHHIDQSTQGEVGFCPFLPLDNRCLAIIDDSPNRHKNQVLDCAVGSW